VIPFWDGASFLFRTRFGSVSGLQFFIGQELFRINESLTLDSLGKLDSNHIDSEVCGASSETAFKKEFTGGLLHGACTRGERVRPIRFHQRIGAIDRKTSLS
jgi:hypothetical protein